MSDIDGELRRIYGLLPPPGKRSLDRLRIDMSEVIDGTSPHSPSLNLLGADSQPADGSRAARSNRPTLRPVLVAACLLVALAVPAVMIKLAASPHQSQPSTDGGSSTTAQPTTSTLPGPQALPVACQQSGTVPSTTVPVPTPGPIAVENGQQWMQDAFPTIYAGEAVNGGNDNDVTVYETTPDANFQAVATAIDGSNTVFAAAPYSLDCEEAVEAAIWSSPGPGDYDGIPLGIIAPNADTGGLTVAVGAVNDDDCAADVAQLQADLASAYPTFNFDVLPTCSVATRVDG